MKIPLYLADDPGNKFLGNRIGIRYTGENLLRSTDRVLAPWHRMFFSAVGRHYPSPGREIRSLSQRHGGHASSLADRPFAVHRSLFAVRLPALSRRPRIPLQEYIFTLRVKQFLAHIDMRAVCDVLPNLTMVRSPPSPAAAAAASSTRMTTSPRLWWFCHTPIIMRRHDG